MATRISQDQLNKFINPEAAMAPYERAEKQRAQQSQQDAALSQLIKGDQLKAASIEENTRRARAQAAETGMQPGKFSINANESGFSVNPESENLAQLLGIKTALEDRQNKATERFADRQNKLNIPARSADLLGLETATAENGKGGILTNPEYKAKSASPVLGYTPDFLKPAVVGVGEKLGGFEKGTGKEMQALQSLYNSQIKSESGAAVNMHEQGRQDISLGTKSGDSEMVKRGVERIKRALEMDTQLLEGSAPDAVKNQYREQGGEYDINRMLQNGGQKTNSRLEELRAKRARGEI